MSLRSPALALAALALTLAPSAAVAPARADMPPPPVPAPAAPDLDALVDGVTARYAQVTDFKATFRQVVVRKQLPRPLAKRGTVFFKRPGMMRWDYSQPEKVFYISDGETLWAWQPEDKLVTRASVKGSELYGALKFLFGQGDLRGEFRPSLGAPEDGLAALTLEPRTPNSNYRRIVLLVDPATFEIRRTRVVDPLDNVSTVTFESPRYEPLKPDGFRFTPPAGARVEDLGGAPTSPPRAR